MPRPLLFVIALALAACGREAVSPPVTEPVAAGEAAAGEAAAGEAAAGEAAEEDTAAAQTGAVLYVPAYSHVYHGDRRRDVNLATTLSIRNTDAAGALRVTAVRYYDSAGTLVRAYVDRPVTLAPLASVDYVVDQSDTSGGSGASFIVEWRARAAVSAPVVEAVMISTQSQQGISFVTEGRVVRQLGAQAAP